jgi:ABC-2 type transport system permease protein
MTTTGDMRAAGALPGRATSEPTGLHTVLGIAPAVVYVMWRREMVRYLRDRSQLWGGLSRTILWLVVLGFGLGAALREIEGYTYGQYILPGVITLNVLFASLQCAIALVWDREVGLLREVMVSPAPVLSVTLGKLLGGASISVIQGTIPLLFMPMVFIPPGASLLDPGALVTAVGVAYDPLAILQAWVVMFFMGIFMTALGVIIASRLKTYEGFGAISNGVIQPLYFLSGSIFPLRGVIGGVGFMEIPEAIRDELRRIGIFAIGGGWVVQLPAWLQAIVFANPVTYQLDMLRYVLLDFEQMPLTTDLLVTFALPPVAAVVAAWSMARMLQSR